MVTVSRGFGVCAEAMKTRAAAHSVFESPEIAVPPYAFLTFWPGAMKPREAVYMFPLQKDALPRASGARAAPVLRMPRARGRVLDASGHALQP